MHFIKPLYPGPLPHCGRPIPSPRNSPVSLPERRDIEGAPPASPDHFSAPAAEHGLPRRLPGERKNRRPCITPEILLLAAEGPAAALSPLCGQVRGRSPARLSIQAVPRTRRDRVSGSCCPSVDLSGGSLRHSRMASRVRPVCRWATSPDGSSPSQAGGVRLRERCINFHFLYITALRQ